MRKKLTVSEFAKKIGKSRQTIYNYINKLSDEEKENYFIMVDNKKYLTLEYQDILLRIFNISEDIFNEEIENQIHVYDLNITQKEGLGYNENDLVSFLKKQIKEKDNQIAELHKLLALSNKEKIMLIEKTSNEKESLLTKFKKIFKRS